VVEALTTTAGIVQANGGWNKLKSLRDSFDFFGAKNQFAKDQLGAFPMEDWYLNVLAEASPEVDISVTPFKDRQGNPLTFVTGSAWAIPKGAKNPDAACRFAKTMTEAGTWVAAAKARAEAQEEPALHRPIQRQQGGRRAGLRRGLQAERGGQVRRRRPDGTERAGGALRHPAVAGRGRVPEGPGPGRPDGAGRAAGAGPAGGQAALDKAAGG
jgi:Bacterial extracellular solute-binding protein